VNIINQNFAVNANPTVALTPSAPTPHAAGSEVIFTADAGSPDYDYRFWLHTVATASWAMVQDYGGGATWTMPAATTAGSYVVAVDARSTPTGNRDAVAYLSYEITLPPATSVTITPDQPTPHTAGTQVVFTADAGAAGYQYRFWLHDGANWSTVQDYGVGATWTMPANQPLGDYMIAVDARANSTTYRDTVAYLNYQVSPTPATGVTITPEFQSPHAAPVLFTAAGQGSSGYQYRFWLYEVNTANWSMVQDYGIGSTWQLPLGTATGDYVIAVDVRTSSGVYRDAAEYLPYSAL
jgi:hypothetical protein